MTTASRPPRLAALGTGERVAARSGLVQLVLHGPGAVGGEKQVLLGLLSHCGWCQDEQGQGDCDRGFGACSRGPSFQGSSTLRRRAVRRPASMRFAGQLGRFGDAMEKILTDVSGSGVCRASRTSFLALQIRASTCQQFHDVVGQAAHAEAVRLSPRTVVPSSSGSNGPCSVASAR